MHRPFELRIGSQVSGFILISATGCRLLGKILGTNPTAPTWLSTFTVNKKKKNLQKFIINKFKLNIQI